MDYGHSWDAPDQRPRGTATTWLRPPPFGSIVVATDGADESDSALLAGAFLAARTGAAASVVSVCETARWGLRSGRTDIAAAAARAVRARTVRVERQLQRTVGAAAAWRADVRAGALGREIAAFAASHDAGVVVIGRRAHPVVDRVLGHEHGFRILRASRAPVFAATAGIAGVPREVVVAVNFGAAAARAARLASRLVASGGTLHVVHVMSRSHRLSRADAPIGVTRARRQLRSLCDDLALSEHARIRPVLLAGDPVAELLAFATLHEVDLLACGSATTSDRRPSVHVGSVASGLFRAAPCSVLVARAPGERWEGA